MSGICIFNIWSNVDWVSIINDIKAEEFEAVLYVEYATAICSSVVIKAFSIYLFLGLFIYPVFHQGGSVGYLLTPNFGYLLGVYPLINIIDNLNTSNKLNVSNFLINGFIAIGAMHLTGIFYNFIQVIFYSRFNMFLYNLGKYSVGKIGYHFLMLFPLLLFIKPIKRLKQSK